MVQSRFLVLSLTLLGVVLVSGCRTYGDGKYGTSSKTYEALRQTVQSFEEDLSRATSDLQRLKTAAAQADTLRVFVDRYQTALEQHKSDLKKQRKRVERLSKSSTYRNLHSAYGATITEQRMTQQRYQRIVRDIRAVVQGTPAEASQKSKIRRYTIRPVNFPRPAAPDRLTMEQALQGL